MSFILTSGHFFIAGIVFEKNRIGSTATDAGPFLPGTAGVH